jgi:acyl-homoserine lactone acylase PvdQ
VTQADQIHLYTQYREQMRASTVAEFQHSLRHQARSTVNLGCADVEGNIGYVWLGRAAKRPPGFDFTRPVPGNTSATEWGPFYPFEALPQLINPEAGFFQNCNNSAWLVTPSGEIGRDFPPEMVPPGGSRSGRPRRALEILEEPGRRFSVDDMKKLALDVKVVHARETIDHLKAMLPREVRREPEIAAAFELFEGWSGYATRDNRALYLLTVFCWRWSELPEGEGRLERALREAIAYAEKHHGRIDVPWGEVHGVERGGEWFPSGGASNQRGPVGSLTSLHHGEPLRNRPDEGGRFPMEKGSSHVMVAQMTDPPRVWSAKPFGNTADPSSRHYADLTALFAAGELRPVWIERNDILANAESVLGRRVEMALPASLGVVRSTTDRVVELAALSDNGRVTIDEVGGRPFTARIELAAGMRVRVLETDGRLIEDWADHQREVPINRPVVIEFTGR